MSEYTPWVLLLPVVVAWMMAVASRRAARRRRLSEAGRFGGPIERERDAIRVAALRSYRGTEDPGAYHDEQVWRDLDMEQVFATVDRTVSWPGMQVLRDRLSRHVFDSGDLDTLEREVSFMADHPEQRARYAHSLAGLSEWSAGSLCALCWGQTPPVPWYRTWLLALTGVMIASLVGTVFWPPLFVLVIALGVVNQTIRVALRAHIEPWLPAMRALPVFLHTVRSIASRGDAALEGTLADLRESLPSLSALRRVGRHARLDSADHTTIAGAADELVGAFREMIGLLFLLDVHAFLSVSSRLAHAGPSMRRAFLALGRIDVAISIASLRAGSKVWTRPSWHTGRVLAVEGLVHPLLTSPVPVSVGMEDQSWLVTGSNMSGKSTLLRSLGVGSLMATSLGTVLATRWEASPFRVLTCIGRTDAIAEGRSYYLAEVERIRVLLDAAGQSTPCLFLLDELYRGTNTPERVAASLAVIEYLDRPPHLTVVATHDLELLGWLQGRFASWHYREEVRGTGLHFDYQLRPGGSSTRNAIALLSVMEYPVTVVERARSVVDREPPAG